MNTEPNSSKVEQTDAVKIARLQRQLARSEAARTEAEGLLEQKARLVALRGIELQQREAELVDKMEISSQELIRAEKTGRIATLHWPKNSELTYSPFFREMLGIKSDEKSVAERAWRAVHPLDRARVSKLRNDFLQSPVGTDYAYECRMLKPNGDVMWFKWSMAKQVNSSGTIIGIYGTVQDITDARAIGRRAKALQLVAERRIIQLDRTTDQLAKATERERQNAEYLTAVLNSVPIGVAVFDDRLRLVSWNAKLIDLVGQEYSKMSVGMTYSQFESLKSGLNSENLDVLSHIERDKAGKIKAQRHLLKKNDGRHIQISIVPHEGGMVRTYADITELKNIENRLREQRTQLGDRVDELETLSSALRHSKLEAERANRAKSEFLTMMSHDIRTPMNGVLGMLSMLEETELLTSQRKQLKLAMDSGDQLKLLLNDIIDLARAESGAILLEPAPVILDDAVSGVLLFWSGTVNSKGIELDTIRDPLLPASLLIDPTRFRQLLDNLVSNGIKYTAGDGGRVTVSLLSAGSSVQPLLRVEVKDNGMGIAEELQSSLFVNYNRTPEAASSGIEGVGLGLAICNRLIEAMGGSIGVESSKGEGSLFWFEIPMIAVEAPSDENVVKALPRKLKNASGQVPHILVAEDVETNQLVIALMLDLFGCTYDLVANGQEAIAKVIDQKYDVILMDVSMPVMDGKEATQSIRSSQTVWADIPIIGVTAHAMETEREKLIAIGMNYCLAKPIDKYELAVALGAVLFERPFEETAAIEQSQGIIAIDIEKFNATLNALSIDRRDAFLKTILNDIDISKNATKRAFLDQSDEFLSRSQHRVKGLAETFGLELMLEQSVRIDLSEQHTLNEFVDAVDQTLSAIRQAYSIQNLLL